jgi:hypothetical protein
MTSLMQSRGYARVLVAIGAIAVAFVVWAIAAQAQETTTTTTTTSVASPTTVTVHPPAKAGVGVVDPNSGRWWLRDPGNGKTTSFYYGNPGDFPIMGDWNCDGIDTPGLYRQSDGYVYLRNTNTQGNADIKFYFGDPGDIPLAGDFDGDGCDTVSVYRPSESRIFVINRIATDDTGLGAAESDYVFGNPGDKPFVGDFDGDGVDTVGLHREATGYLYFRNTNTQGVADLQFYFGDPRDRLVAGDWTADGVSTPAIFRPSQGKFYLRHTNSQGNADEDFEYGGSAFQPIAGEFGSLPGGDEPPPRDQLLVSQFTTYHPCCQSRVTNIHLIADAVDGAIVQPGETFSLNAHVGPRTTQKGYVEAGAIIGGEIVTEGNPANIGGGTSQFATTFYNAIFYGGYEDVYHKPHSLYFTRYPVGIEATLGYPGPDVIFRNDTVSPVRIDTSYTSGSVTVRLIGNNEGRVVTGATSGSVSSADGGTVRITRTIRHANGAVTTNSWRHTYNPMPVDEPTAPSTPSPSPPPPPPPPDDDEIPDWY